jgi:hypothetical protein
MERIRVHTINKDEPENIWQLIIMFFKWDSKEFLHREHLWMVANAMIGGEVEERGYSITLTIHRFQGKARLVIWENIPNKEKEPWLTYEMAKDLKEAHTIIKSFQ